MRGCLVVLLGGCLLALAPVRAEAATVIHVDNAHPACSDTGPGSATTPLCSINAGTTRAVAGDTVLVFSGTYAEQATVANSGTAAAPILVTAAPSATVTVTGQANGFRVATETWVTIRGFDVVDTTSHGINVTNSSNITIEGNDVTGAGTPALDLTARGISFASTTNSVVRGNFIHGNSDAGISVGLGSTGNQLTENYSWGNAQEFARAAAGIDVRGAGTTVSANVAFDNEDSGINIWNGANASVVTNNTAWRNGDHGIDIKSSNQVSVLSNTVHDNPASGIEVFSSTDLVLANNILLDNGLNSPGDSGNLFVDTVSTTTMSADYDLMDLTTSGEMVTWGGVQYDTLADFTTATGKEANGIDADPRFVDAASGDLRLLAGSPAIDSANAGVANHPATDSVGNARVDDPDTTNTGVGPRLFDDRGAFELQANPGATVPSAPTIGAATAGDGQANLTWTAPADDGGSPITGYSVTPFIGATAQPVRTFNTPATTQAITGLTNGTSYTFTVAAINAVGTGAQSAASNAVTPATIPSAPTIGTATAGNGQASLTWTAPAINGGSPITGYSVTPFIGATAQPVRTFNTPATTQTITGLTNGTSYTFRVAAINAVGTGAQSGASNAVTPAVAPSFTTGPSPSVPGSPPMTVTGYTPVAGDFNGDNRGDVFWYGPGSKTEVLWTGRSNATFAAVATLQQPATLKPLAGDFNGDGRDDVFWYGPGATAEAFWLGTTNGAFSVAAPRAVSGTYTPVVGDFNGDTRSDIYWYRPGSAVDARWNGQANATFVTVSATPMSGTFQPVVGQFGGDASDDIYWYAPGTTAEVLWRGTSAGSFTVSTTRNISGTYTPVSGDFNGDGHGDIFWYGPGTAADALWNGSSTVFVNQPPRVVNGTYVPVAPDVNGDGHDDIYFYTSGSAADALILGAG